MMIPAKDHDEPTQEFTTIAQLEDFVSLPRYRQEFESLDLEQKYLLSMFHSILMLRSLNERQVPEPRIDFDWQAFKDTSAANLAAVIDV